MHNKARKIVYTFFVILLAFGVLAAGSSARVSTVKFGEDVEVNYGRAGVSFVNSQFNGDVKLTRKTYATSMGGEAPVFTQKLLDVRLYDLDGVRITHVVGSVYVYFKIKQKEFKLYNAGHLSIYFYDTWTKKWTECSTVEIDSHNGADRLACRIRVFGLYGIGLR